MCIENPSSLINLPNPPPPPPQTFLMIWWHDITCWFDDSCMCTCCDVCAPSRRSPRPCWAVTSPQTISTSWRGQGTRRPPCTRSSTRTNPPAGRPASLLLSIFLILYYKKKYLYATNQTVWLLLWTVTPLDLSTGTSTWIFFIYFLFLDFFSLLWICLDRTTWSEGELEAMAGLCSLMLCFLKTKKKLPMYICRILIALCDSWHQTFWYSGQGCWGFFFLTFIIFPSCLLRNTSQCWSTAFSFFRGI